MANGSIWPGSKMGDKDTWSLCLTSRQGRKVVKVAATASTQELYQIAGEQFDATVSALKHGFPPRPAPSDSTLISTLFQNQERIQVEFDGGQPRSTAKTTKKAAAAPKADAEIPTTSPPSRRSKRAAAQKATESMPDVIKAQEAILKQQKPPAKRARTNKSSTSSRVLKTPAPPRPNFAPSAGQGRRLADGATSAAPKPSSNRSRKRANPSGLLTSNSSNQQPADMSETLLGALNNKGKMGQALRKGMKNAVQSSYSTTQAFARLAAIQARNYKMEEQGATLIVAFHGSVDKTEFKEQVDCIPRDVLEAVIRGIHTSNVEALRPENLTLLSPRVLWSLVHCFPDQSSIPDMYKQLLSSHPDLDWSFLRRRAPQLSEKALENLRQEQEASGEAQQMEDGGQAIAAVEEAMENLHDYEATERKARPAQAALSRLQATTSSNEEWKLVTPAEPDRDELRQCIDDATNMSVLINKLMKECRIHNWRELANVKIPRDVADKLGVATEQVETWIDRAQAESVDEIIVDICDGSIDAVVKLTEKARAGTPKDLAAWRCIPELLHKNLSAGSNATDGPTFTVEQISVWCKRAHDVLRDYEWLQWYATPVE